MASKYIIEKLLITYEYIDHVIYCALSFICVSYRSTDHSINQLINQSINLSVYLF